MLCSCPPIVRYRYRSQFKDNNEINLLADAPLSLRGLALILKRGAGIGLLKRLYKVFTGVLFRAQR